MSERNDGGPAFPVASYDQQTFSPSNVLEMRRLLSGMTLRDYFAAAALTGSCANGSATAPAEAKWAYEMADAMLAERAK